MKRVTEDLVADKEATLFRPVGDVSSLLGEHISSRAGVDSRHRVRKVACVGGGEVLPFRIGGDEEVEQDWRDAASVGDTGSGVELRGSDVVEAAAGHPNPEVGCHPAYSVVPQLGEDEGSYQLYELDGAG